MAESYGGKYGPTFSAYMEKQNALLKAGKLPKGIKELHLESLGIGWWAILLHYVHCLP